MDIKKFVIKSAGGYEDRTDCWFRTGGVWHQTVPSNCLLLTLDPNVKSIFNENLFVILDSKDYGNTYGKTVHSLEEHNIILSTDVFTGATGAAEQNGPETSIGYFLTSNTSNHNHGDVKLYGGKYSGESFYGLFNRYAVGAYTKDYILSNSLLLSTKDISNGSIEKIVEDLYYFLFIDAERRGKLAKDANVKHNHGGNDYTHVETVSINEQQTYTKASTTGITAYSKHTHKVNYNISASSSGYDKPKKFLVTYYNKTTSNLYFDELPIGTIMLFIDEYNDYMYNWIPLECSKIYCCNMDSYNYGDNNIYSVEPTPHRHTAEILSSSLVGYVSGKYGGSNMRSLNIQDHSHTFTFGDCERVYLEPYGIMLKPYIKISNNKPNF